MNPELSFPIQTAWLIPLYGFIGMVVSLPWAAGWFRRQAHRPAAYLNILLTLLAFVHGSLILQEVFRSGPVDLAYPWLSVADLQLDISFSLTLNNLVALELITASACSPRSIRWVTWTRNGPWPVSSHCLVSSRVR